MILLRLLAGPFFFLHRTARYRRKFANSFFSSIFLSSSTTLILFNSIKILSILAFLFTSPSYFLSFSLSLSLSGGYTLCGRLLPE
jgi:hypothetical protein